MTVCIWSVWSRRVASVMTTSKYIWPTCNNCLQNCLFFVPGWPGWCSGQWGGTWTLNGSTIASRDSLQRGREGELVCSKIESQFNGAQNWIDYVCIVYHISTVYLQISTVQTSCPDHRWAWKVDGFQSRLWCVRNRHSGEHIYRTLGFNSQQIHVCLTRVVTCICFQTFLSCRNSLQSLASSSPLLSTMTGACPIWSYHL